MTHVHETTVAMEKQYYIFVCARAWVSACVCVRSCELCGCTGASVCLCAYSLTYPAWNAHALYRYMRPLRLYLFFDIIS